MSKEHPSKERPIQPEYLETMNLLARRLDEIFNGEAPDVGVWVKRTGFALLVFPFDAPGRCNYISNAERADMLTAMKEFIARAEGRMSEEGKA